MSGVLTRQYEMGVRDVQWVHWPNYTRAHKTFDAWMSGVDGMLREETGLSSANLPDVSWRDWYDAGYTVGEALLSAEKEWDVCEW